MKKILFVVMLVVVFSLAAMAQHAQAPITVLNQHGNPSFHGEQGWGNQNPNAAKLIFYGGDSNPSDPNVEGFANGNTLLVPTTTDYGAVTAPTGSKVVATGVLFNQVATQTGTIFDPATATYDIRTGVSEGVGGTSVASGSGKQTATVTGRQPFGFIEYSTSVAFTKPLTPKGGTTYWVNESPQCTDTSNAICSELQYFFDNTTEQTNGINAKLQPGYEGFFNSAYFGYTWANNCDLVGGQSALCEWQSFGIYGTL